MPSPSTHEPRAAAEPGTAPPAPTLLGRARHRAGATVARADAAVRRARGRRGPGVGLAATGIALAVLAGAAVGIRVLGTPTALLPGGGPTTANGWPAISDGRDRRLTPSAWVTGSVRAGDVDVVLIHVADRFNGEVEPVDRTSSWGWSDRDARGDGGELSNHASGTAVDLNATAHPVGEAGTFTPEQVAALRDILADLAPVVAWGGDFDRPDEMHFEIVGTPQEVAEVAERLMVPRG